MSRRRFWAAVTAVASILPASGQNGAPHWGAQGDGGYFSAPSFLVEKIHTLPEKPSIEGASFEVGIVRFNEHGAPSYALQFSQIRADLEGSLTDARGRASVSGRATMRGFMATKYLNFVTTDRASAGIGAWGGIGALDANYIRTVSSPTATVFSETRRYEYTIPLFEIHGRIDFRVSKYVTIGPYYGVRNGLLGGGACVRLHFVK